MKYSKVKLLFSKLKRFNSKLKNISGEGITWNYKFKNGTTTKYTVKKLRDLESIQDDVENYFIWLWNMKDYLKSTTKNQKSFENFVNKNNNLKISGDIANYLKHSNLNNSKSLLYPKLGKLKVTIPQKNISKLVFYKDEIEIDPINANEAELSLPIYDNNQRIIIDAFELIKETEKEWEKIYKMLTVVE